MLDGFSSGEFSKKYANVVVVAKSGGDYSTVHEALDAINPTAENPYLVKVMPGVYSLNYPWMKSHTHLQGAGAEVTALEYDSGGPGGEILRIFNNTNVMISGFTFTSPVTGGCIEMHYSSNVKIMNNKFSSCTTYGIAAYSSNSMPLVFEGNSFDTQTYGIVIYTDAMIRNNTIANSSRNGIVTDGSSKLIHNWIVGNGDGGYSLDSDIRIAGGTPNISYNIYDTIIGTGTGVFNGKSDGTPW